MNRPSDLIELKRLEVECIIGVYPRERVEKQSLIVHLGLETDTSKAGRGGGLAATIDYSQIAGEVRFLLEACEFELIEEAAEAIAAWLLSPGKVRKGQSRIHRVQVALDKPAAMGGNALPCITITREAADYAYDGEDSVFGNVDIIYEIDALGIYELRIAPGSVIPPHFHKAMTEAELILDSGVECQNEPLRAGLAHFWPKELVHTYKNTGETEASILCVDRPRFIREDEVESEAPLGSRHLARPTRFFGEESPA
jgi:FolB domain-containing protein